MRGFRAFIMNGLRWEIPSVGYFKYCMHVAVDHIYFYFTPHILKNFVVFPKQEFN